mgnify:CR=1 FL=1
MSLKKQAVSGVKWNFLQQISVQAINFAVQIILARLLMPEEFGLIAMIIVFIAVGHTLTDSGMTSSLIRTENPTELDYSTVFVTNLAVSIFIYGVVYLTAPYIAGFYNQKILEDIIRLLSLTFIIRALFAVHIAKLTKEMNFKLQMQLHIPPTLISGALAVYLAFIGYGVWSLVWLNLLQAVICALLFWLFAGWRPKLSFSKKNFNYHFIFGYKLTLSSLLNTIYDNSYRIVIGKMYSPATVGFFNLAETMRLFPVQQISAVLGKVTYPLFASINNDDVRLKEVYRLSMKFVLFIVIPLMLSLILLAEEWFLVVFGEHWLPAVPLFQILALASIVRPISSYNLNILKVKGRSDLFLKLEIIKKLLGVLAIIFGLYFGITGLVISLVIHFLFTVIIDVYFSGVLISYSLFEQFSDLKMLFYSGGLVYSIFYLIKQLTESYLGSNLLTIFIFLIFFNSFYYLINLFFDRELWVTLKKIKKSS